MNTKCPKCQTENPSDSKFCKECEKTAVFIAGPKLGKMNLFDILISSGPFTPMLTEERYVRPESCPPSLRSSRKNNRLSPQKEKYDYY
jgi:hypothetical protein